MSDSAREGKNQGPASPKSIQSKDAQTITVSLGPLDYRDKELIRGWRNSFKVWKWCRQNNPISDLEQERWFNRQTADPSIQMYKVIVTLQGKQHPVGVCGFTSIDLLHRRAEFSLYIAPHLQGHGFGKGAMHCLLDQGFDHMGFHTIWGETFDGNPAARMFEKIGFVKEGTRRDFYFKNGRYIDAHLYSIKEEEWQNSKSLSLQ